ncbi:MAG: hypothetical protein AAF533_11735 [Acidobacteriota bacterium]
MSSRRLVMAVLVLLGVGGARAEEPDLRLWKQADGSLLVDLIPHPDLPDPMELNLYRGELERLAEYEQRGDPDGRCRIPGELRSLPLVDELAEEGSHYYLLTAVAPPGVETGLGSSNLLGRRPNRHPCWVARGSYQYQRLPVGGLTELVSVDFHPDGDFFLAAERSGVLHVHDVVNGVDHRVELGPVGNLVWDEVEFSPDGSQALVVGHDTSSGNVGVVRLFDAAGWIASGADPRGDPTPFFSDITGLPVVETFSAVEYPDDGGLPVLLSSTLRSPYSMVLRRFDPAAGDTEFLTSSATTAGCQDIAFVDNEWDEPGILVVCGVNGYDGLYYTEVGGFPELRLDLGFNNHGNTRSVSTHPGGDYALAVSWSGRRINRFEEGLMTSSTEAPWFSTRAILGVEFQQTGRRALIHGGRMSIGGNVFAAMVEYRHDLYDCPAPLTADCAMTEVSIPNFGSAPWNAPNGANVNDVAWRPGCDEGVIVGGYTNFMTEYGFIGTFEIEGGLRCP